MERKIKNHDMPVGQLRRAADLLPPPNQLALPEETIKVTIALKKTSIEFFKHQAQKHHTKYQKMIRELLDRYAGVYQPA